VKVVIDTNVLLVIVPQHSPFVPVYKSFLDGRFRLLITTEILLEYEEQLKSRYSSYSINEELIKIIEKQNTDLVIPDFKWNLISADPDDNKFVDCAVAANADFIVTNDAHFNILKTISFPKVNTISLQEFILLLQNQ